MENAQELHGQSLTIPLGGNTVVTLPLGAMTEDDYNLLMSTLALWKPRLIQGGSEKIGRPNGVHDISITNVPFRPINPTAEDIDGMFRDGGGALACTVDHTTIKSGTRCHNCYAVVTHPLIEQEERQEKALERSVAPKKESGRGKWSRKPDPNSLRFRARVKIRELRGDITVKRIAEELGVTVSREINDAVQDMFTKGELKRIGHGTYRNANDVDAAPPLKILSAPSQPAAIPAPKAAEVERAVHVQKMSARAETEAAKAVRRAVAVMNTETFTREDITEEMKKIVGERMVATWNGSGGLSGTLLDLRNLGMLELHPSSKPGRAVYMKAQHFQPVAA